MSRRDALKGWSGLCYLVAAGLIGFGFFTMFTYGDGDKYSSNGMVGHIVGGDAYNYIIIAVRGLGFITSGLAVTVVGAATSILSALAPAPDASPAPPEEQPENQAESA